MKEITKINESLEEVKGIPQGDEFENLPSIYKCIESRFADSFNYGYDRKKSQGWKGQGADCYGIVGYAHLSIEGAKSMLGYSYPVLVEFKVLGGFDRFVFFDAYSEPEIMHLLLETYGRNKYGKPLSVQEQLYRLTGDYEISQKYGSVSSTEFGGGNTWGRYSGQGVAETIMRKTGKYIRGMVVRYGSGDVGVFAFNFGDMITYRVATGCTRNEPTSSIQRKLVKVLDEKSYDIQNHFIDLVPHLWMANADKPDAAHSKLVDGKWYVAYTTADRKNNMLIVDDENWANPKDIKLFPNDVILDEPLANPDSHGFFRFFFRGYPFIANVRGEQLNGYHAIGEGGKTVKTPIFSVIYGGRAEEWYPMSGEILSWLYNHPNDIEAMVERIKEKLAAESGPARRNMRAANQQPAQPQITEPEDGEEMDSEEELKKVVEESFTPGMSYNDFVQSNDTVMYVCTHCYLLQSIMEHGFSREFANANDKNDNGGLLTYGEGVYGTPDLRNAANNLSMKPYSKYEKPDGKKYGDVILKCVLLDGWKNFLIFDRNMAQEVYGAKWKIYDQIDAIVKNPKANQELKNYVSNIRGELYDPGNDRTTAVIFKMFNSSYDLQTRKIEYDRWTKFFSKNGIRGCIYTGYGDKFCCVCYDYSEVIPIEISYDHGRTWTTEGGKRTLDNGKTYAWTGINWEATRGRLEAGGDPKSKLGAFYKHVNIVPRSVKFYGGAEAGLAQVQTYEGKWNFVTMQDIIGNDGNILYNKYSKIFPIDFDDRVSIDMQGEIYSFEYKGLPFEKANVYNEECNGPSFTLTRRSRYTGKATETWPMTHIDWFVENYDAYMRGDFEVGGTEDNNANGEEYQVQDDSVNSQELQESFFRFLDKMELL